MPDEYLNVRIKTFDERFLKTREFLEKLQTTGDLDKYWVCEVNGEIIGICQYSRSQNDKYKESGLLGALYVLKKSQGIGVGKTLFKMAVQGLKELGYKTMYLNV